MWLPWLRRGGSAIREAVGMAHYCDHVAAMAAADLSIWLQRDGMA